MRKLLLLFLPIYLLSCSNESNIVYEREKLTALDSILSSKPKEAFDSLNTINKSQLSTVDEAYFNLLLTIAMDKNDFVFINDSLIHKSVEWYNSSKDYYNLYRSTTYWGIVRYAINKKDTLSFSLFKKAEGLFLKNKFEKDYLIGMIYNYLGKINKADLNFSEADYYITKSVEFNRITGNTFNYIISLVDLTWVQLNLKNFIKGLECINILDKVDSIPQYMRSNVYNVKSAYFASTGNYKQAVIYAIKNIEESVDLKSRDNQYYALSAYYVNLNQLDSAVYYAEKSIEVSSDTIASSNYNLYKHLADVYKLKKEYEKAADTYFKAYQYHQQYVSEISTKKILELEKRYNIETKDFQLNLANQRNYMLTFLIAGVSVIFLLLVALLWFRVKITRKEYYIIKQREEISAGKTEAKHRKQKVINDFLKISLSLHPEFTENYLKVVNNKYNLSPELYKEFQKINKNFNSEYRKNINVIIENELNDLLDFIPPEVNECLSSNEKVILFLTNEGYTTAQIAELLNTTTNSIRTSRMRLISKISDSELLSDDVKNSLKNFLHLHQ